MQSINNKSAVLDKFIFIAVLILFSMVSLVPFFAMKHIKIMNLPIHYLIVGGSVSILVILTLYNQKWKLTSFDKWLFVFMFGFSMSLITSVDRIYTIQTIVSFFLRGVGVAFVVHKIVTTEERKNQLVLVLLLVASVVCLIGLVEFFTGKIPLFHNLYINNVECYPISFHWRSGMMSTVGHPLILSAYLVSLLPLAFLFSQNRKSFLKSIPLVLIFLAILTSFSRSSWIVTFCIITIYSFNKEIRYVIFNKWKLFLILLTVFILLFCFQPKLRSGIVGRFSYKALKSEIIHSHRLASYKTTWNILKQYPIFGVGMGNYPKVHIVYRAEGTGENVETPDNMYLRFISEVGIVGTLTFFCFVFYWMYQFWRNRNDILIWTIFTGLVGFLINQMVGDFFYWLPTQFLFWFMLGIGVASLNEVKRNQGQKF